MVTSIYGGVASSANPTLTAITTPLNGLAQPNALGATAVSDPRVNRHPSISSDDQIAILDAVDLVGVIGIGNLADAIPRHERPISAILALIDAGLLDMDDEAAFDASLRIRRAARLAR